MNPNRNRPLNLATQIAQALHYEDKKTGSVVPPIQHAATYARDHDYNIRQPFWYRRDGNETTEHAEKMIAAIEGAEDTMLFSSGMSACTAVIEQLPTGAHIVVPEVMYHGVLAQIQLYAAKNRLVVSYYTAGKIEELSDAIRPGETLLVWVETPNNPNWEVTDINAASNLTRDAGAKLIVDATATPPTMTRALELGADYSFHSATKYLNGHSDVTAGALSVKNLDKDWEELGLIRKLQGTVLQSNDAWLLIRGMRTLHLRVTRACESAIVLAEYFEGHPGVEKVLYPGLKSHPGHEIARRQTDGQFGAMLSIIIKGSEQDAIRVASNCDVFYPATSLGGVESLIEHRKTVSGDGFPVHERLLRLSIGIEDVDDLIYDLERALARTFS